MIPALRGKRSVALELDASLSYILLKDHASGSKIPKFKAVKFQMLRPGQLPPSQPVKLTHTAREEGKTCPIV